MQNELTEELRSATRKNEFIFLHWLMNSLRHTLDSWCFEQKQNNANLFANRLCGVSEKKKTS